MDDRADQAMRYSPSMRRPVRVKTFLFLCQSCSLFFFSCADSRFPRRNLAPGCPRNDDSHLGRPTASPVLSALLLSMRRPVRVKTFLFLLRWILCLWAEPPLSPSFHPQSFMSDCRSLQGGCPRFNRCCYLVIDLGSYRFDGSWART
jgi:hypothetical protein